MAADDVVLWYADEDTSTSPYDEILTATIAGFTGQGSIYIRVYDPGLKFEKEGEDTNYANGEVRGSLDMRKVFEFVVVPFSYKSSSWDVTDLEAIMAALQKPYKWIFINTYAAEYNRADDYHDALKAIPVELLSFEHTNNRKNATESLTLKFAKVWDE